MFIHHIYAWKINHEKHSKTILNFSIYNIFIEMFRFDLFLSMLVKKYGRPELKCEKRADDHKNESQKDVSASPIFCLLSYSN